jgi:hypothetical protein
MAIQLSPGLSFCRTEDGFVFLDLRSDRYFQLAPRDHEIFERLLSGDGERGEVETFVAAGILQRAEGAVACGPAEARVAPDDIYSLEPRRSSLAATLEAGYHVMRARRAISAAHLATTIADLSRRKASASCDLQAILAAALRFDANRSSIPIARRCLIDSVALMRMLLARGLASDLIFGVRTGPFAAHCWLQAGDHVLTCAQDDARNFTPILVI